MSTKFVHSDLFDARYAAWQAAKLEVQQRHESLFQTEEARKLRAAEAVMHAARRLLVTSCEHPESEWAEFTYTHRNGYGSHTQHKGVRCNLCYQVNHYSDMSRNFHVEMHDRDDD